VLSWGGADCSDHTCAAPRHATRECEEAYAEYPRRTTFFRNVQPPPNVVPRKFQMMLAQGGIHPRGVVLTNEFFQLPLALNVSLLQEEVDALLETGEWEGATAENEKQGVVSKHFRLTKSVSKDLEGPFVEVENRLQRSPYLRSVLAALGGVVGNVALMSVEPGGEVEAHFDTSAYWEPRVRVHIPIRTNKKAIFKCGQVGDMHKVNMKVGKVYVFDNHVAHEVQNQGSSLRIHLTVDLVGSRRFWNLMEGSRFLGSVRRKATMLDINVTKMEESRIAIESWRDADLQDAGLHDCKGTVDALGSTAAYLGLEEAARQLGKDWCEEIAAEGLDRAGEVRLLQNRAAAMSCGMGVDAAVLPSGLPELVDVADSISEVHRMAEAHRELQTYGATQY